MAETMFTSPTRLYEEGNWYILLALWIKKVNDVARMNYDSATPEYRAKESLKSFVFKSGELFKQEVKVKPKPRSSMEVVEIGEVLNRQNKKR